MSKRNNEEISFSCKRHKAVEDKNIKDIQEKQDWEENYLSCDVSGKQTDLVIEAGSYYLGPVIKKSGRNPATQCLARRKGTDDYYLMKILILKDGNTSDKFQLRLRAVFHNEYTILSLLKGHPGVIQVHDFFKDSVRDEDPGEGGGKELKRICMVLECLIHHGCHNEELTPLPEYVAENRRLSEAEALRIFASILLVIDDIHKVNIVHKDLKLCNIVLNRRTLQIKLINFYCAKLISSKNDMSHCQKGDPSFTTSDVIAGNPISPKQSFGVADMTFDMWSAGVILYTMLHGYLPFIGNRNIGSALANTRALADLYSKIITNDYVISDEIYMSEATKKLIRGLLCKDANARLKAGEAVDLVCTAIAVQSSSHNRNIFASSRYVDQVVPECPKFDEKETSQPPCTECWLIVNTNVPNVTAKTYKIAISEVYPKGCRTLRHKMNCKTKNQDEILNGEKDSIVRKNIIVSRRNSSVSK